MSLNREERRWGKVHEFCLKIQRKEKKKTDKKEKKRKEKQGHQVIVTNTHTREGDTVSISGTRFMLATNKTSAKARAHKTRHPTPVRAPITPHINHGTWPRPPPPNSILPLSTQGLARRMRWGGTGNTLLSFSSQPLDAAWRSMTAAHQRSDNRWMLVTVGLQLLRPLCGRVLSIMALGLWLRTGKSTRTRML